MKHLADFLFCLFFCVALILVFVCLSGCGGILVYSPDGKLVAAEFSIIKDVDVQRYESSKNGTMIDHGSSKVNDAAVQAITDGVVAGLIKGIKP